MFLRLLSKCPFNTCEVQPISWQWLFSTEVQIMTQEAKLLLICLIFTSRRKHALPNISLGPHVLLLFPSAESHLLLPHVLLFRQEFLSLQNPLYCSLYLFSVAQNHCLWNRWAHAQRQRAQQGNQACCL